MKARLNLHVVRLGAALALAFLASPAPLLAVLGGNLESVQADQVIMQARLRSLPVGSYTMHEISAPTGTIVREYLSSEGKVFAISWRGPTIPNLRQVLGPYFDRYVEAARAAKAQHHGRGPLLVHAAGLVVQTGGHARAFSGRAYVPEMLPPGVQAREIQ